MLLIFPFWCGVSFQWDLFFFCCAVTLLFCCGMHKGFYCASKIASYSLQGMHVVFDVG